MFQIAPEYARTVVVTYGVLFVIYWIMYTCIQPNVGLYLFLFLQVGGGGGGVLKLW